jgi:hypothetical protein
MQPKEGEQTKKIQHEKEVQQKEEELHARALVLMDQQWQEDANDMVKWLVVMKSSASTTGDLDAVVEQLEMLAQKIRKKNGEVLKL